MEYINSNFATFSDLAQLEQKLQELENNGIVLEQQISAKSNGVDVPKPARFRQAQALVEALQTLQVSLQNPAELGPVLDLLIQRHGPLDFLLQVKQGLLEKAQLQAQVAQLEEAAAAEQRISLLSEHSPVAEFTLISQDLSLLQEPLKLHLQQGLGHVVQDKKKALSAALSAILLEIHWLSPKEKVTINLAKLQQIQTLFADMLALQASVETPQYPGFWWALETLLEPFFIRFNFHFADPLLKTNKISKPEWALAFCESFLLEHALILELVLDQAFLEYGKIGLLEVITFMLVPLRTKLELMVSAINKNIATFEDDETVKLEQSGRLLSHLIFETTSFDQRLRTNYKYNPFITSLAIAPQKKWLGMTGDILADDSTALQNWLKLELRLAKKRFDQDIVARPDAFEIDFDYNAGSESPEAVLNPSYSAFALVKLFDNLTSHFKTLSIVKYQLKYVSKIQLSLLDEYLVALEKKFGQFNESLRLKLMSSFLPGNASAADVSAQVTTNGLKGLEILTGLYCLAKFLIDKMEEWTEDLIFVQLWEYCQDTSQDSIFGDSLAEYRELCSKITAKYGDFFRKEIRGALKEYVNSSQWNIEVSRRNSDATHLVDFSMTIPPYLAYLKRVLPDVDYFMISSGICDTFAGILMEYVITNNQFTKKGVQQFQNDLDLLTSAIGEPLLLVEGKYSNLENKKWKRLLQAVEMMKLLDYEGAKMFKKRFDEGSSVRALFEDKLDCLSNSEIHDLLYRIV